MMSTQPPTELAPTLSLEQLLNRKDIWRGDSYCRTTQKIVDSGFTELNKALINGGWPRANLVEICQKGLQQLEWLILLPALKAVSGYIVLLNPPSTPFCQAFIQAGIDLERVIVVHVTNKADFLASFSELARTQACEALFSWQPQQPLSYTELRKCLLATNDSEGLCVLFRPENSRQQSSPAGLRVQAQLTQHQFQLSIFKQKGALPQTSTLIGLPLPTSLNGFSAYSLLDQTTTPKKSTVVRLTRSKK